jgi:Zn-dependent protease with chaperone function
MSGCASAKQAHFQEAIRKAARGPVTAVQGEVPALFRELAQAGGVAPTSVYVALHTSDTLNAAALGNHHFLVTRGAVAQNDRCFLMGLVAHEMAHDILKHPEAIARTSDTASVVSLLLGTAAGAFVPGAGYLVSGAAGLGLKAYSRAQESEADALAVKLLRDAGKPEWALRYALGHLRRQGGADRGGGWLSTHPALAERIEAQPPLNLAEVRQMCPWAPGDPPPWCRGANDRYDPVSGACVGG